MLRDLMFDLGVAEEEYTVKITGVEICLRNIANMCALYIVHDIIMRVCVM